MKDRIQIILSTTSSRLILACVAFGFFALASIAVWQVDAQRTPEDKELAAKAGQSSLIRARLEADHEHGASLNDLSRVPLAFPEAGTTIYAYDALNRIKSFDASAPETLLSDVPLIGLTGDEIVYALDFRPSDGGLYGIISGGFPGPSRLVRIDPVTGVVTRVHPTNTMSTPLDSFFGFDFDPVEDRIRQVGHEDFNRRISPGSGTLFNNDTMLRYAAGDVNAGANPRVVHIANSFSAGATTVYGIDVAANTLVRIGGVNGSPSAITGEITTIGPLGIDPTHFGSMDIQQATNTAYASLFINSEPIFVRIDLTTGAASVIGRIGGIGGDEPIVIDGIAISQFPVVTPSPTPTPNGTPIPTPFPTPTPLITPSPTPPNASVLRATNVSTVPGANVTVAFFLDARGGEKQVDLTLHFNPAVLSFSVVEVSTQMAGSSILTDRSQVGSGRLGVKFDASSPLPVGAHRLFAVTFLVSIATPSGVYPLTFGNSPVPLDIRDGNGNSMVWWFQPGNVVLNLTAAGVEVSGRVLTPDGRGLRNATVSMTGIDGTKRTVTTSSFGYYRFENAEAGGTYVMNVASKRYRFSPRAIHVADALTDVNFVAN